MGNCRTEKAIHCQQKRGGTTTDPRYVETMPQLQGEQKRLSACGLSDTTHSPLPLLPMPYYVSGRARVHCLKVVSAVSVSTPAASKLCSSRKARISASVGLMGPPSTNSAGVSTVMGNS